ncbi:unnamed protein product [Symbiodinium sp. CCMP2592]|nr:unnamed protein product [Symbiodinium sp. CCMP2592]
MFAAQGRALRLLSQAKIQHNLCHLGAVLIRGKLDSSAFNPLNKTAGQRTASTATCAAEQSFEQRAGTTSDETIDVLRRENKLLRSELAELRWPQLHSFQARGRHYPLPWHPPAKSSVALSKADLQYLSGVFDGDGCALGCASRSTCMLSMTQSYDHAEVLLLFQDSFGGSICSKRNSGTGLTKPTLQWQVYGAKARLAARDLSPHSSTKRSQLELIADWPNDPLQRIESDKKLRLLKTQDSAAEFRCSWGYCAGFLDADGCIWLSPTGSVFVQFSQKYPTVLEHIRNFMAEQAGVTAKTYQCNANLFTLRITKDSDSKRVLKCMLDAGLRRKAVQASLVVSSTHESVGHVREAFARCVGNQNFGKRLDEDGIARSVRITNLQMRVRYWKQKGQTEKAATVSKEIQVLQCKHRFLKAQLENRQLLEYREMLQHLQFNSW